MHPTAQRSLVILTFLLVPGGAVVDPAPLRAETSPGDGGRSTIDLSGRHWQMEGIRPGQGILEGFHEDLGEVAPSSFNWNGAAVPGDVYTDLWRAGEIDDPHYGRDGMKAKWVMEKEWWYRCRFGVPEAWKSKVVRLVFEGVDYSCDVWVNGVHLGRHEGMFSSFEFDVSSVVRYRSDRRANGLVIRLDPPPRLYRSVAGRKFAWHGDYWRSLAPLGIWKPIRLEATGPLRFADVHPSSEVHADGSATVGVEIQLAGPALKRPGNARVRALVRGKNLDAGPYTVEASLPLGTGESRAALALRIPDAKLWWPWELGRPHLHVVETTVFDDRGELCDRAETTFGIRQIRMERNPGYTESEVHYPWTLVINGRRLFLRSANWVALRTSSTVATARRSTGSWSGSLETRTSTTSGSSAGTLPRWTSSTTSATSWESPSGRISSRSPRSVSPRTRRFVRRRTPRRSP